MFSRDLYPVNRTLAAAAECKLRQLHAFSQLVILPSPLSGANARWTAEAVVRCEMRLIVCAIGHRMPPWIAAGFQEFASRMPREIPIELVEVRPEPRPAKPSPAIITKIMAAEAKRVLACLPVDCFTVALDERGKSMTSERLARSMEGWMRDGNDVAFVIGGADGLDQRLKHNASLLLSLSSMTLPHQLVRVLLAEQLYRAMSLLRNHPYHRA